jgi:hypothetical protein
MKTTALTAFIIVIPEGDLLGLADRVWEFEEVVTLLMPEIEARRSRPQ